MYIYIYIYVCCQLHLRQYHCIAIIEALIKPSSPSFHSFRVNCASVSLVVLLVLPSEEQPIVGAVATGLRLNRRSEEARLFFKTPVSTAGRPIMLPATATAKIP